MNKLFKNIQLTLVTLLAINSGCTCLHRPVAQTVYTPAIASLRIHDGPERQFELPKAGVALAELIPFEQTTANQIPGTMVQYSQRFDSLTAYLDSAFEVINERVDLTEVTDRNQWKQKFDEAILATDKSRLDAKRNDIQQMLDELSSEGAIELKRASIVDELIQTYVFAKLEENKANSAIDAKRFLSSYASSLASITATDMAGLTSSAITQGLSEVVVLRRKDGQELVMPRVMVHQSSLGAILLTDGDNIRVVHIATLGRNVPTGPFKVLITGKHIGEDGAYELPANILNLKTLVDKPKNYNVPESDDTSDVVVLTRMNPVGRPRTFILPTHSASAMSDINVVLGKIYLQEGDIVHYDTLDLLPIVIGSRAWHKRQQLSELPSMKAAANAQTQPADPLRRTLKKNCEQISELPVVEQVRAFSSIARERITSNLQSVGNAVGLR